MANRFESCGNLEMKIKGSYHAHAYTWFVNQESEVKLWTLDLDVCGYSLLSQSKEPWKISLSLSGRVLV